MQIFKIRVKGECLPEFMIKEPLFKACEVFAVTNIGLDKLFKLN